MKSISFFAVLGALFFISYQAVAFEAGEHALLGNSAFNQVVPDKKDYEFQRLLNAGSFTYGELVALGGDFYKTPEGMLLHNAPYFSWFHNDNQERIKKCIRKEIKAIREERQYTTCEDIDLIRSKAQYVTGAHDNFSHFSWHNVKNYVRYHSMALKFALLYHYKITGDSTTFSDVLEQLPYKDEDGWLAGILSGRSYLSKEYIGELTTEQLESTAIYFNAFADHFLTDAFSAGHLRVPRSQIDAYIKDRDAFLISLDSSPSYLELERKQGTVRSGAYVQFLHNLDGKSKGVLVTNSKKNIFYVRGDKYLFADSTGKLTNHPNSNITAKIVIQALRSSIAELKLVFLHGRKGLPGIYKATEFIPTPHMSSKSLVSEVQNFARSKRYDDIIGMLSDSVGGLYVTLVSDNEAKFYRFIEDLPKIMEKFRRDIAYEIKKDSKKGEESGFVKFISPSYLRNIQKIR
ncbi:MAG: hypothetical protein Q3M24_09045 [Candidatus Electrothrix aestuarii]|uniref:Uncharacterized protein n=1 Tax=Candidatus Electrothrix aestuarii TaxID=3062594 RepID=A0AAU8M0Y5_9BACT|nr:hypothetical protein [Candidatus Electrothrix aestuarii]